MRLPNWAEDSFQSLGVAIQQGKRDDAIGTLACILYNSDSDRMIRLATDLDNGSQLKHPAN